MKGGKGPTAGQKRWHTWLAEQGCACCGAAANIHHCVGSTGKHNKVHIGQDFVIPLCYDHHQGPGGIHSDARQLALDWGYGSMSRKQLEKTIFNRLVAVYRRQRGEYPCPPDVLAAIEGWHR